MGRSYGSGCLKLPRVSGQEVVKGSC